MGDDLRVTIKLGLTIPLADYASIKPEIVIANLDPAGDVPAQLEMALEVAGVAFGEIDGRLSSTISSLVEGAKLAQPEGAQRLDMVEQGMAAVTRSHNSLVKKLREEQALREAVEAELQSPDPEQAEGDVTE